MWNMLSHSSTHTQRRALCTVACAGHFTGNTTAHPPTVATSEESRVRKMYLRLLIHYT